MGTAERRAACGEAVPAGETNELRMARNPAVRRACVPLVDVRDRLMKRPVIRGVDGQIHGPNLFLEVLQAQRGRQVDDGAVAVREGRVRGPVGGHDASAVASSAHGEPKRVQYSTEVWPSTGDVTVFQKAFEWGPLRW